jgi:hypothetical protein
MTLPHDLQHFPNGALILTSDSVKATFYLVGGDSVEELGSIEHPREKSSDAEGERFSTDGTRVIGLEPEKKEQERLHQFVHDVATQTEAYVREHNIPHIHLVLPTEVEREFSKKLPPEIHAKIGKTIHADVMKESVLDIVKRVVAHLGIGA